MGRKWSRRVWRRTQKNREIINNNDGDEMNVDKAK